MLAMACSLLTPPIALGSFLLSSWFSACFCFDLVHYLLHQWSKSTNTTLRQIARIHMVHHYYFNRKLRFNDRFHGRNLASEIPLELCCQLLGAWLGSLPFRLIFPDGMIDIPACLRLNHCHSSTSPFPTKKINLNDLLYLVLFALVLKAIVVIMLGGRDSNHQTYGILPKDPNWLLVGPEYHALHHIDPSAYLSSVCRVLDLIIGSNHSIKTRRITMTGSSGALGAALHKELEKMGVKRLRTLKYGVDWTYGSYDNTIATLRETDILILTHGSKDGDVFEANCTSALRLIRLFQQYRIRDTKPDNLLLPEIWYVGSEVEFSLSGAEATISPWSLSKMSFLPYARNLYDEPSLIYRHIVPSPFDSSTAAWTAHCAMWWLKRGARYVPVTQTGVAYLNFFKFLYWTKRDKTLVTSEDSIMRSDLVIVVDTTT